MAVSDGAVLGDNCQLLFSATLGGGGTLTEADCVIDDQHDSERRTAESNCRGDAEIGQVIGKPSHAISGNMLFKHGTPGATYETLRAAYYAGTVLHWAFASDDPTESGAHVFRLEGQLTQWNETHPDGDTVKVAFAIAKDATNTYASNYAVTA